jgi:hypothetical protein
LGSGKVFHAQHFGALRVLGIGSWNRSKKLISDFPDEVMLLMMVWAIEAGLIIKPPSRLQLNTLKVYCPAVAGISRQQVDKLKDWDVQAKSMKMSVFKTVRTV